MSITTLNGVCGSGKLRTSEIMFWTGAVALLTMTNRRKYNYAKLSPAGTLPASGAVVISCTSDAIYLAVPNNTTSPYVLFYKRTKYSLTKLSDPGTLPPSGTKWAKFSPDGNYVALGSSASPYIIVYSRSGDTFTKLSDPGTLPSGTIDCIAWSTDSATLLTISGSNWNTYSISGSSITLNISNTVESSVNQCAFSYDNNYIFAGFGEQIKAYTHIAGVISTSICSSASFGNVAARNGGLCVSNNSYDMYAGQTNGSSLLRVYPITFNSGAITLTVGTDAAGSSSGGSFGSPNDSIAINSDNSTITALGAPTGTFRHVVVTASGATLTGQTIQYGFPITSMGSAGVCVGTQVN